MKFIVDQMPSTCGDCEFMRSAVVMSQLGVAKNVELCTLQVALMPPNSPTDEMHFIDKDKTPEENNCLCTDNSNMPKVKNMSTESILKRTGIVLG